MEPYNNFEIQHSLESMKLLLDTREHLSKQLQARLDVIGIPYERRKLDVGDYSCSCTLPDGSELDMSPIVVIERKMSIDELCMCFGRERDRFHREFERAMETGTKIYLIVENATWEKIYSGKYESRLHPNALVASIDAYRVRYNMQIDFCKAEISGKRIHDILYRELKHYLESEGDMYNLYSEIRDDLKWFADEFETRGFTYKAYNRGIQYNVEDLNGVIQEFFPTTGTIKFHRSNDRKDRAVIVQYDNDLYTFIDYLRHPEKIQELFNNREG